MKSFVGLGVPTIDRIYAVPEAPRFDSAIVVTSLGVHGGGPVATGLVTIVRLGHRATLIARIGDDAVGYEILRGLEAEGVDTRAVEISGVSRSATSLILVARDAARAILYDPGERLDANIDPETLESIRESDGLLLQESTPASFQAARAAQDAGVPVLLDADAHDEGVREIASLCDIVIASENYSRSKDGSPEETVRHLLALGPSVAVVTLGERGAVGATPEGDVNREPAYPVEAKDTTGAGDVYHGAFFVAYAEGRGFREAMRFAACAAALKCRSPGGRVGIPSRRELEAALVR